MIDSKVDIKENDILEMSPELLNTLLKDHTLSNEDKQVNIFWATDNYAARGAGYQYSDPITIEAISGENGDVIVPRSLKSKATQQQRSREMAEVFTPSWICNEQNNLVENAWFVGRVFSILKSTIQMFKRLINLLQFYKNRVRHRGMSHSSMD